MNNDLIASKSIAINATADKVWDVLTNPDKIKIYLFGTETTSDWKIGSPIRFKGTYNGQTYEDKGNVLESVKHKLLKYNYWSGFSGLEDVIENYSLVTYNIKQISKNQVEFTWEQQGFPSEEGKCHIEQGLIQMLLQIKQLAEEK
ncbi:MAG: SRPBCC family protein [Bacteroidota bacterium]